MKRFFVLAALLGLVCTAPAAAQTTHTSKVSVPTAKLVGEPLDLARKALEQDDLEGAIEAWQSILDLLGNKVVAAELAPRTEIAADTVMPRDRFSSARDRVIQGLSTLPPEGLERYRELMEPRAADLLARGRSLRSGEVLCEAILRYPLTASGQQAWFDLIDLQLEDGHLVEARLAAEALLAFLPETAGHDRALAVARLGFALMGLGDRPALRALAGNPGVPEDQRTIVVAGEEIEIGAFLRDLLERTPAAPDTASIEPDLSMFNDRAWEHAFNVNRNTGEENHPFSWQRYVQPWADHYPVLPTVRNGNIYSCDGLALRGRSLLTGEDLWPPVESVMVGFEGRRNRNLRFEVALDDQILIGTLEGDPFSHEQRAWQGFRPIEAIPSRHLVATDPATGEVLWSHMIYSDPDPGIREFVDGLSVNTAPLILGDRIYVVGVESLGLFREWMCAFDKHTGRLIWRTYLGQGQMELNMFGNPIKEAIPGLVGEHRGTLFVSTNLGTMAAVEAMTGMIRWISAYVQEPIPTTRMQLTRERYEGWKPSRPAFHGNRVFMAPTDSCYLYAVDTESGEWITVPAAERTILTRFTDFLGIHGGKLIVSGRNVVAIDPETLREEWRTAERDSARGTSGAVMGRPWASDDSLVFTTLRAGNSGTDIFEVDLDTGRFLAERSLPSSNLTGNVVIDNEAAVIATAVALRVFYQPEQLAERLTRAMRRSPDDPGIRIRLGELYLKSANPSAAIKAFEKALSLAEAQGPRGRALARKAGRSLHQIWLILAKTGALRSDVHPTTRDQRFAKALDYASTEREGADTRLSALVVCLDDRDSKAIVRYADDVLRLTPRTPVALDEVEVLNRLPELGGFRRVPAGLAAAMLAARALEEAGDEAGAVSFYQQILERFADEPVAEDNAWSWAGERIGALIERSGRRVYARQEKEAKALYRRGVDQDETGALRELFERYPQSTLVDQAWLELSRRMLAEGRAREALSEIQRFLARFRRPGPEVLAQYARSLQEEGLMDSAYETLQVLARRWPETSIEADGSRLNVAAWVHSQPAWEQGQARATGRPLPVIEPGLRPVWSTLQDLGPARLLSPQGEPPAAAASLVLVWGGGSLNAVDSQGGGIRWACAAPIEPHAVTWHDGQLLMLLEDDALAIDGTSGEELWRVRLTAFEALDLRAVQGKVFLLLRQVLGERRLTLRALDIATGQTVAETGIARMDSGSLDVSPSLVMVSSRNYGARIFDALTGEQLGSTLGFGSEALRPFLTNEDLVVIGGENIRYGIRSLTGAGGQGRILALDPRTGLETWSYPAGGRGFGIQNPGGQYLVVTMEAPRRSRSAMNLETRLVVLDVSLGAAIFNEAVPSPDIVTDSLVAAERLYVTVQIPSRTRRSARVIRAFDLKSGRHLWDTPQFADRTLDLTVHPARETVMVRRVILPEGEFGIGQMAGELYLLDGASGRALDQISLDKLAFVHGSEDMVLREGRVILAVDEGLQAFGP